MKKGKASTKKVPLKKSAPSTGQHCASTAQIDAAPETAKTHAYSGYRFHLCSESRVSSNPDLKNNSNDLCGPNPMALKCLNRTHHSRYHVQDQSTRCLGAPTTANICHRHSILTPLELCACKEGAAEQSVYNVPNSQGGKEQKQLIAYNVDNSDIFVRMGYSLWKCLGHAPP